MISGQNKSGDQTGTVEEIEFTDAKPAMERRSVASCSRSRRPRPYC